MKLFTEIHDWLTSLPRVTRLTLRREFTASIPLAVIFSVTHGSFCAFVGRKALHMTDDMVALLMSCGMGGLLISGALIGFFSKRRKSKALAQILVFSSVVVLSISLLPQYKLSRNWLWYIFIIQVFLGLTGHALATALRSSIWRANYPTSHRAKIIIILYLCITVINSLAILIFTTAMDYLHLPFQVLYFVGGLMGLASAYYYSRIRIRHEGAMLRNLQNSPQKVPIFQGLSVLASDKRFRRFMSWQMLNGFSTMIIEAGVLVLIIADVFQSGWLIGGAALVAIPTFLSGISGLFWARLFDRSTIFKMRFLGSMGWALSRVVLAIALWQGSIAILLLSRVVTGIAMGLGQLTWRLGHMEFAQPEKDSLYMGAHISLTGLRGIVTPFIGIFLYRLDFLGPHGIWLVALSVIGQIIAALGFLSMGKTKNKSGTPVIDLGNNS